MRTVSYRLGDLARATIKIGKVAENEYTRVQFNAEQIFAEYPAATATLNVINPAGTAYPAVVTREGDLIIWDVTDADLTAEGMGELQLTLTENGVVCKSFIARTRIERSIVASGSTPDPVQNWLDNAAEVLEEVQDAIPAGGTQGQVMGKLSDDDYDIGWIDQTGGGGGGGTSNYNDLSNKPQIAGTTLSGNKTLEQLGIAAASDIPDVSGFYTKPASGIPASDLASGVIPDVSGFYTKPQSGIPASDLADGVIPDVSGLYTKPSGGIPKSDLASGVQSSLGKADTAYQKPSGGIPAADIASGVIPDPTDLIDDTAGDGDTNKVWSADKTAEEVSTLSSAIAQLDANTPENYGAKGDGTTDDSSAVQQAINSGYAVHFGDNKTYYLASPVTINHDCHLIGGKNTTIITKTPSGGTVNNAIVAQGTLKKTTTLTTNYSSTGSTDNSGNQFTLSDMTDIAVGDIMVITATDQYYSYARPTYYLGATLLISDIYNGHIYTSNSMPWDITNSENVSVTIYSAPTVIIENLNIHSDMDSLGSYKMLISLKWCKNSVIRNCNLSQMAIGMRIDFCVNTLVDCVTVSKSKYDNSLTGDGYGIYITSSTETIVQRLLAICAQGCVDLGGTIPNINTYVRNCNLTSECRAIGIDMHENSYNIVIEDCTFGGISLYGTATVNRCRFIRNNRSDATGNAIMFRGSHNPDWGKLKVSNCEFDGSLTISIARTTPQTAVQSFENVIGNAEIVDCFGGSLVFNPDTTADVTGNRIKNLILRNWKNCGKFLHSSGNIVENMVVADCTFTISSGLWATDNVVAHGIYLDGVKHLDFSCLNPLTHKVHVEDTVCGYAITIPKNVSIALSSSNSETAKYIICGNNLTSDSIDDYVVESVSGNVGSSLTRTIVSGTGKPTISMNASGDVVYTQGGGTGQYCLAPVGMVYAKEASVYSISATLKNTGETTGQSFYPYIAIVNCDTGKVVYRGNGTNKTASAEGTEISHSYNVDKNCVVFGYFACSATVANAVTTFDDLAFTLTEKFNPAVVDEPYNGKRMTGDGTLTSIEGVNNIMSHESSFTVKINANYADNPIGVLPSGSGVSF